MAKKKITMVDPGQITSRGWKGFKTTTAVKNFATKYHVNHVYWRKGNTRYFLVDVNDFTETWREQKKTSTKQSTPKRKPTAKRTTTKRTTTRRTTAKRTTTRSTTRKPTARRRTTTQKRTTPRRRYYR